MIHAFKVIEAMLYDLVSTIFLIIVTLFLIVLFAYWEWSLLVVGVGLASLVSAALYGSYSEKLKREQSND